MGRLDSTRFETFALQNRNRSWGGEEIEKGLCGRWLPRVCRNGSRICEESLNLGWKWSDQFDSWLELNNFADSRETYFRFTIDHRLNRRTAAAHEFNLRL